MIIGQRSYKYWMFNMIKDEISNSLGLEPLQNLNEGEGELVVPKKSDLAELKPVDDKVDRDYDYARTNFYNIIETGTEALEQMLDVAKASLDTFGTDALKSLLQETGLGNHPEVIRFMYRAGKAISEDSYVGNSEGAVGKSNVPKDFNGIANALYSNQQSK